jgi:hypothetical protein
VRDLLVRRRVVSQAMLPPLSAACRGFRFFGVLICARPLGFIGFPRSHRALAVSDGCRGFFSSDTVRRLVTQAVSSSRKLFASSQCFRTGPAPNRGNIQVASRRVHLPWSSHALMTTSVSRIVTTPGLPTPDASSPLAFLPPSTISSTTDLASLFHLAAAFRIHSSRDFPPTQPR